MTVLVARGIRKSFGRRRVLAGLDLEAGAGEMVAVAGENGTGKTTLLRILAGDLRPDAGSVAIRGRPGYCPQTAVLDEALTVDQHVRYFQAAYGIGRTGRAEALIERLGYAGCRDQRAGTLSGGTRQKLSLTLALMRDPPVLWFAQASLEAAISANCSLAYQIPVPDNRFPHTFSAAYHHYMSGCGPRYTTAP